MLIASLVYEMRLFSFQHWLFNISCFQANFELLYQTVLWKKNPTHLLDKHVPNPAKSPNARNYVS